MTKITATTVIGDIEYNIPMEFETTAKWDEFIDDCYSNIQQMSQHVGIDCMRCAIGVCYEEFPNIYDEAVALHKIGADKDKIAHATAYCQNVLMTIIGAKIQHVESKPDMRDFRVNLDKMLSELEHTNEKGCEQFEANPEEKLHSSRLESESPSECPSCGKMMDGVMGEDGKQPEADAVSICVYCQEILQFNADLSVRKADLSQFDDGFLAHLKNLQAQIKNLADKKGIMDEQH